ncbi:MAG TPA: DUF1413 domain-containing protein [Burkholderiales bacterium]|nr:DUF1413 domain-containing protein [Burkholderiales bacterium]
MNNLLLEALKTINNHLNSGDEFVLEDLFTGVRWKNIPPIQRREFGRFFFQQSTNSLSNVIQAVGKNSGNAKRYKKI